MSSRASAGRSPISPSLRPRRGKSDTRVDLLRLSLEVDAAQVEAAIAAWELAGVYNSSVEYLLDPEAEPVEEIWPQHDHRPTEGRAEVAAYLAESQWERLEASAWEAARRLLGGEPNFQAARLPDRDWRTAWHDHFQQVRIPGERPIVVCPPHLAAEVRRDAQGGELVVELAPGLAFGTGQHQSTRLCLAMLAEQVQGGERVLDVGTGSGILATAAALLGARAVQAVDIDALAVEAARQTVRQNGVSDRVSVREGPVPTGDRFDVVAANLTADILQHLAGELSGALSPGGRLIVSGLIAQRESEVASAFEARGLRLQGVKSEDEWRALLLVGS